MAPSMYVASSAGHAYPGVIAGGFWREQEFGPKRIVAAKDLSRTTTTAQSSRIDHSGQPSTHRDFGENWLLVSFGMPSCSDVCPTTLRKISQDDDVYEIASPIRQYLVTK